MVAAGRLERTEPLAARGRLVDCGATPGLGCTGSTICSTVCDSCRWRPCRGSAERRAASISSAHTAGDTFAGLCSLQAAGPASTRPCDSLRIRFWFAGEGPGRGDACDP